MGRRGRREKRDEEEIRIIEKAMEMIEEVGFERAMLLLYEAAMRAERKEYQEKHPEDSSNGYYRRRVKIFGKEESVRVPRTRKGGFRSKLLPEKWSRNREVGEKLLGDTKSAIEEYEEIRWLILSTDETDGEENEEPTNLGETIVRKGFIDIGGNVIRFNLPGKREGEIGIYNTAGRLVFHRRLYGSGSFRLPTLPNGVYIIRIDYGDRALRFKAINMRGFNRLIISLD